LQEQGWGARSSGQIVQYDARGYAGVELGLFSVSRRRQRQARDLGSARKAASLPLDCVNAGRDLPKERELENDY
jgi:hypothetical protein